MINRLSEPTACISGTPALSYPSTEAAKLAFSRTRVATDFATASISVAVFASGTPHDISWMRKDVIVAIG
jgi:hypothetical protein